MTKDKRISLALICGGTSGERSISLKGAEQVAAALDASRYNVRRYDPSTDLARLASDADQIDVALVILHGINGEDGTVQGFLDLLGIPYQGAGVLGSAVAMNKLVAKRFYETAGIRVPAYVGLRRNEPIDANDCMDRLGLPLVVKPASGGSSLGMSIVRSADRFENAIAAGFCHDDTLVVEEYISGREITVAVLGNDRLTALPIVEIVPREGYEFFDFKAKYTTGETQEICPARIDEDLTRAAQNLAIEAHRALFLSCYSRTDMIIRDGQLFVLETNTIPGMTENSLLPLAAKTAGFSYSQLLDRLVKLALEKRLPEAASANRLQFEN